jgi:hypothetical protein
VIDSRWVDGATLVDAVVGAHIAERAHTGRVAAGWEGRLFDLFWPIVLAEPSHISAEARDAIPVGRGCACPRASHSLTGGLSANKVARRVPRSD